MQSVWTTLVSLLYSRILTRGPSAIFVYSMVDVPSARSFLQVVCWSSNGRNSFVRFVPGADAAHSDKTVEAFEFERSR